MSREPNELIYAEDLKESDELLVEGDCEIHNHSNSISAIIDIYSTDKDCESEMFYCNVLKVRSDQHVVSVVFLDPNGEQQGVVFHPLQTVRIRIRAGAELSLEALRNLSQED
jgi:hypothetical protein